MHIIQTVYHLTLPSCMHAWLYVTKLKILVIGFSRLLSKINTYSTCFDSTSHALRFSDLCWCVSQFVTDQSNKSDCPHQFCHLHSQRHIFLNCFRGKARIHKSLFRLSIGIGLVLIEAVFSVSYTLLQFCHCENDALKHSLTLKVLHLAKMKGALLMVTCPTCSVHMLQRWLRAQ